MAHEVDLRGLPCPLTWARARVRLESLPRGTEVTFLIDDARSVRDLPRAAEASGHHVVDIAASDAHWRITLEA
ncbi:MAG: sulfurtransferase TusA family protein [Candidatus Binatia bacterium]